MRARHGKYQIFLEYVFGTQILAPRRSESDAEVEPSMGDALLDDVRRMLLDAKSNVRVAALEKLASTGIPKARIISNALVEAGKKLK